MAKEVDVYVMGVVITSSPTPTPHARRAVRKASVPEPTPKQYVAPQKREKFFSNSWTGGPKVKVELSASSEIFLKTSFLTKAFSNLSFKKGTFMYSSRSVSLKVYHLFLCISRACWFMKLSLLQLLLHSDRLLHEPIEHFCTRSAAW